MKVSILTHSSYGETGGINKYVDQVVRCVSQNSLVNEINIFAKLNSKKISQKTNIFVSRNFLFFTILFNLRKLINSDIILITHLNLIPYLVFFIIFNKKIILFSYGLEVWGQKKNFFYKYLINKINFFICMREYTKKELIKKYKLQNKKYYLLHNFIDEITKYKKIKKSNIILTIARLDSKEKFKGIDETLEAISLIKKKKFKYYILGDGDDKNRLIKKSKNLNINNTVKFFGHVSHKKKIELLKKAKILSMPGSDATFDTYPYRFSFLEAANYSLNILGSVPFKSETRLTDKYKIFTFVNPKNRFEIKRNILKLLKKRNFFSNDIHKDFSKLKFCSNLNNILLEVDFTD